MKQPFQHDSVLVGFTFLIHVATHNLSSISKQNEIIYVNEIIKMKFQIKAKIWHMNFKLIDQHKEKICER